MKSRSNPDNSNNNREDSQWLDSIEKQFIKIAGDDHLIDKKEFETALNLKPSFFSDRFFQLFDKDGSGSIELSELMDGLQMLTQGDEEEKLRFLFDVYDVDGSGSIDKQELRTVLQSCVSESSLNISESDLDALTDVLFESADEDKSGSISFDELKQELEKHPGVLENLTISAAQWLKPSITTKTKKTFRYLTVKYWRNNLKKIILFMLFFITNIVLFAVGCYNYRNSNGFIIVARGCGMALNFDCAFILVTMLRKCLTYLRSFKESQKLPLDQHILLHKITGVMVALLTVIHTLAHIGNAVLMAEDFGLSVWEFIFTTKANLGWVAGFAPLSGVFLDVILIVIVLCALPFVRRMGHFQVFYWTHIMYVPFWILLILHAKNFWMWFVVPGFIFLCEKISRSKLLRLAKYGETHITAVNLLPSKVTHLVISKPTNWRYECGDYVFIQIPVIAKNEWHPFTISSAPEVKGNFSLHIRSAGHWTNKLYTYFDGYNPAYEPTGSLNKAYKNSEESIMEKGIYRKYSTISNKYPKAEKKENCECKEKSVHVKVYIDGPYGTSARAIFETEHAVLIGSGIGVTPYASILRSILYRYEALKKTCPSCSHSWYDEAMARMKLKKVDFIWINRDQKCFEWFVRLLTEIEFQQSKMAEFGKIIDMHMYMTSALSKNDMKGLGLQMALELLHQKQNRDVITGLRTKTHAGRPNFTKLFDEISKRKKGKVKVFLCGPPALAKDLKEHCSKFAFDFSKENF